MKNKVLKIVTVVILLATLTMANFIYVGYGLVSYAASSIATNHQNVEFDAQLKEGNILSLLINVKKKDILMEKLLWKIVILLLTHSKVINI